MMTIGIRELKQRTSEVLRRVREQNETIAITHRGRLVAKLVPVEDKDGKRAKGSEVWAEMQALAEEIGRHWPAGVSATDAVREQRREL